MVIMAVNSWINCIKMSEINELNERAFGVSNSTLMHLLVSSSYNCSYPSILIQSRPIVTTLIVQQAARTRSLVTVCIWSHSATIITQCLVHHMIGKSFSTLPN